MILLVFGFVIVGRVEAQIDMRLNGTWVGDNDSELRYNNGNFEQDFNGRLGVRGTYTTSENSITYTITHLHGVYFGTISPLSAQWHTASKAISRLRNRTDGNYSGIINLLQRGSSSIYAINGDIITFTSASGSVSTFNRIAIISENELFGIWILQNTSNIARNELPSRLEFFRNKTAFLTSADETVIRIGWDFPVRNRLRLEGKITTDIEMAEGGSLLIFHYDGRDYPIDARPRRGTYKKQ